MSEDRTTGTSGRTTGRTTEDRPSSQGISAPPTGEGERYRLGGMLGRGGMGEVLEAYDAQIGRDVAIKRLRTQSPSDRQIARFMREARIQGRLEHPAIVPVHELALDADGKPYFAMKKLTGTTLSAILGDGAERDSAATLGKYPRQRVLRAIADVCLAVELAHRRGFVHRDLKPENIVLGEYGETYVLDWGVAKVTGEDDSALVIDSDTHELVTAQGAAVGTPGYMAPEQAHALPDVDARADVYSLGCILFEVMAGQPLHPKGPEGMKSAVRGVDGRPAQRAPERDIPPELDELCDEATRTDRNKRIATARELGERIQQFLDGDRDLEQRKELAHAHLARAEAAFVADDRAKAMREAGRALALDPALEAASALITRMIIEPPTVLPVEVSKQFDAESVHVIRRTINVGMIASAGYLLFVPLLGAIGGVAPHMLAIMGCASAGSIAMLWWMRRAPNTRLLVAPLIALQVILLATCARMFTPFLFGPALGAVTAAALMTGPQYARRQATLVAIVTSIAVLAPAAAELAGWVSPTVAVEGGVVLIRTHLASHGAFLALMSAFTLAVVTSAVLVVRGLRQAERRARRSMHVQAWQLRQLLGE